VNDDGEFYVGAVVEWGSRDYPCSGVITDFSIGGQFAYVRDARNVYVQVRVDDLRYPVTEVQP